MNLEQWGCVLLAGGVVLLVALYASRFVSLRRAGLTGWQVFWWIPVRIYCRLFHRVRAQPDCPVPKRGPVLVVSNHTCSVDPLLLMVAADRVMGFLVAREYCETPVVGQPLRVAGCIPVDREAGDPRALSRALSKLMNGAAVAVFPEGRINTGDDPLPAKGGVGVLALRSNVDVVPAYISNPAPSDSLVRAFLVPSRARVRFGRPLAIPEKPHGVPMREFRNQVAADILESVYDLRNHESTER